MRTGAMRLVVAGLLVALAAQMNVRFDLRQSWSPERHSLYLPSGQYLRFAALGNRALLADLLYVWSIQYYSTRRNDRWRNLARLYDAITDLDPKFVGAYTVGALILALEAGRHEEALGLLDKGIEALPDTYLLAMEAGFYARDIGAMGRAQEYFRIAKSRPDAPAFAARWYGFLLDREGATADALQVWHEAYQQAPTPVEKEIAARHIHDLTIRLHLELVHQAVAAFYEREQRNPFSLDELVRANYLGALPVDPSGQPYAYDRATGKVSAQSSFLLRHSLKGRP